MLENYSNPPPEPFKKTSSLLPIFGVLSFLITGIAIGVAVEPISDRVIAFLEEHFPWITNPSGK